MYVHYPLLYWMAQILPHNVIGHIVHTSPSSETSSIEHTPALLAFLIPCTLLDFYMNILVPSFFHSFPFPPPRGAIFFCVIIFLSVLVSPVDYMCFYCSCIFCFIIFFFLYSLFAQQSSTLRFLLCIYQMILLCSSSKGFYSTFHYLAYLGFNLLVFNSSFCCYRKITTIRR